MKLSKWTPPVGVLVTAVMVFSLVAPASAEPVDRDPDAAAVDISVVTEGNPAGEASVSTQIESELGMDGEAVVAIDSNVIDTVSVETAQEGDALEDTYSISDLTIVDDENFSALLASDSTGETHFIDTTATEAQVLPLILVVLARVGIQMAIRQFSKAAVQSAAKKYALSLTTSKWTHIMARKHNWRYVGGTTRAKVADLMSKAVANGRSAKARDHIDYTWRYSGRTITVRTSTGGHISNGWVK